MKTSKKNPFILWNCSELGGKIRRYPTLEKAQEMMAVEQELDPSTADDWRIEETGIGIHPVIAR